MTDLSKPLTSDRCLLKANYYEGHFLDFLKTYWTTLIFKTAVQAVKRFYNFSTVLLRILLYKLILIYVYALGTLATVQAALHSFSIYRLISVSSLPWLSIDTPGYINSVTVPNFIAWNSYPYYFLQYYSCTKL